MAVDTRVRWWHVLLAACVIAASCFLYRVISRPGEAVKQGDNVIVLPSQPLAPQKVVSLLKPLPTNQTSDVKKLRDQFLSWNHCFHALKMVKYLTTASDQCGAAGKEQSRLLQCEPSVTGEQMLRLDKLRDSMEKCGDYNEVDKNYYEATRAAAIAGDYDAQLCYVQSTFSDTTEEVHYTYTEIDKSIYQDYALKFIDAAIKRGDWRIVALLATASRFTTSSGLFTKIQGIDRPEQDYKMKALLLLGATGAYADELKVSLSGYTGAEGDEKPMVSPEASDRATAWATQTYEAYFGSSIKLSKAPTPCGDYSNSNFP